MQRRTQVEMMQTESPTDRAMFYLVVLGRPLVLSL